MGDPYDDHVVMRIFVGEADHFKGKPLYQQIVECLRKHRCAGVTVIRGMMGFGPSATLHTDRFLELSKDLPIVIECIDRQSTLDTILPELTAMLDGGLITIERVRVIVSKASGGSLESRGVDAKR